MTVKSIKNKFRSLYVCGITLAAAMIALTGWGCADSTGPQEGNDSKLILPTGEAWVYTYYVTNNSSVVRTITTSSSDQQALIFKANGKVDRLFKNNRYNEEWDVDTSFTISWSTTGNKLTLREKSSSESITYTFSLTGAGSAQILTLYDGYYAPQGYERREVEIR